MNIPQWYNREKGLKGFVKLSGITAKYTKALRLIFSIKVPTCTVSSDWSKALQTNAINGHINIVQCKIQQREMLLLMLLLRC